MTPSAPELLHHIDRALRESAEVRPGLLDGDAGRALFRAYYFQLTGDDDQIDLLHALVERCLAAVATGVASRSHCSGLAGIGWGLQHLAALGMIDAADAFDELDRVLLPWVIADLDAGRSDFLHDGVGALLYAIERLPTPAARACVEAALDRLERVYRAAPLDLGLAHGAAAALVLASHADERGVACQPLLRRLTELVRAARSPCGPSLYPALAGDPEPSRLGWCYGDLAIASALWRAGTRLGDTAVLAAARELLVHTLAHRDADNGKIADVSLCHGSMGVSHMYRRAALATGDGGWLVGADRWLAHTLSLAARPHGLDFHLLSRDVACDDLLQGTAGVGLALIAALDPTTAPAWDRCLLLS